MSVQTSTSAPKPVFPAREKEFGSNGVLSCFFQIFVTAECLPSKAHSLLENGGLLKHGEDPPASREQALQILCGRNVPEEGRLLQGHCWDVTPGAQARPPRGAGDSRQGHGASCT